MRATFDEKVVLLCFPTRDYFGQEYKKDSEVKEFALKKVPEGLTLLKVDSLKSRPGWIFPAPSWNFGGKWIVGGGIVTETNDPEKHIKQLLEKHLEVQAPTEAGGAPDLNGVTSDHLMAGADDNCDGNIDEAEFLKVWPGDRESGLEAFKVIDKNGDGCISKEELDAALKSFTMKE